VLKDNLCYSEESKAWAVTVAATLTVGRCCEQTALAPASTVRHLLLPLEGPHLFSLTDLTETYRCAGNDGFAGGSTVEGNLVFNMVRETGDQ